VYSGREKSVSRTRCLRLSTTERIHVSESCEMTSNQHPSPQVCRSYILHPLHDLLNELSLGSLLILQMGLLYWLSTPTT